MDKQQYQQAGWINNTTVYEVNLRQYTTEGTFNAFCKELPRLKDMGVATLWFMPITPIAKKNRKGSMGSYYACSDYVAVNPEFGSLADFKNLVQLAHSMGFRVILDWVANHTGWDHVWTTAHPEYYLIDTATNDFKTASGMDDIIELDYKNQSMQNAMIAAMAFWINECDIDGFRCDLAFWVELDFWKTARIALEKIKSLFWLGEFDPIDHPEYLECFDAAYTWGWMHKTASFYKQEIGFDVLKNLLYQYDKVCGSDKIPLWFTSNHDENTWNGTAFEKYGEMAKALAVFSFTWYGMPLVYSGEELPNNKRLAFFDKDTIDWNGDYAMHDFYKKLCQLKKNNLALRAADENAYTILWPVSETDNVLAYLRHNGNDEVLVILNLSGSLTHFTLQDETVTGQYHNIFDNVDTGLSTGYFFELPPWAYLLFEKIIV